MYGEGEFDDSGGLGLLLHAAHPATDVQDERAPFPTRASRQRGHTNSPEEVTGSLEPVTGLDQENLDTQDTQQGGEQLSTWMQGLHWIRWILSSWPQREGSRRATRVRPKTM